MDALANDEIKGRQVAEDGMDGLAQGNVVTRSSMTRMDCWGGPLGGFKAAATTHARACRSSGLAE
jgi:hypothetical protein